LRRGIARTEIGSVASSDAGSLEGAGRGRIFAIDLQL